MLTKIEGGKKVGQSRDHGARADWGRDEGEGGEQLHLNRPKNDAGLDDISRWLPALGRRNQQRLPFKSNFLGLVLSVAVQMVSIVQRVVKTARGRTVFRRSCSSDAQT